MNSNQQLPLDFDQHLPEGQNFVIYRSSAGSGKTHTLVREYLELVLKNPQDYKHILAITFTNKAASEMKERILKELTLISSGEPSVIKDQIAESFEEQGIIADLKIRARKALESILYDYGNLAIGTLDHFFTRLVRSLARELNLPLRYDIDVDNQKAIDFAIEQLYEEIDKNEMIGEWLAEFTYNRLENDKSWRIDQNLQALGMDLFNENFHVGIGSSPLPLEEFQELVDELIRTSSMFKKTLRSKAREAMKIIQDNDLQEKDFKRGTVSYFNNILQDKFEPSATFVKILNGEDNWYTQKSDKKGAIDKVAESGLNEISIEIYDYLQKFKSSYISAKELLKNIFSLGILEVLNNKLQEYREEMNIVLLADNTFLLRNIIEDQDAPFLYEKIGSQYKHIMIDEFQDTSIYQWKNILPLIKNSLSSWFRVLIVGDVKQSIYRWRGGDMSLLLYGVKDDLSIFNSQISEQLLEDNWRSAEEIVLFNNAFFQCAVNKMASLEMLPDSQNLIRDAYIGHDQNVQKDDLVGYVEVQFFDSKETDWREKIRLKLLGEIKNIKSEGYSLGDILILVDRTDPGNEIAEFLINNGIAVVTDSAMQVQQSRVVQLVLNGMRWLRDHEDLLAKTNLLKLYVSINKIDVSDNEILNGGIDDLFEKIIPSTLLENKSALQILPLYEIVESLLVAFDLSNYSNRFLLRFLDVCIEQGVWGRNDVFSFLKWWDENKEDIKIILPEGEEAVEIMTVHKAKGLEKPIVMLPYANYLMKPLPNSIFWTSLLPEQYKKYKLLPFNFVKDLLESDFSKAFKHELLEGMLERLNVVYVAMTRPKERLYIYSEDTNKYDDPSSLNKLIKSVLLDPEFDLGQMENGKFTFGSKTEKRAIKGLIKSVETLDQIYSSISTDRYKIRSKANEFWRISNTEISKSIRKGLILHEILSKINTSQDVPAAINNAVNSGLILQEEVKEAEQEIQSIVSSGNLSDIFDDDDWEILNEREIYTDEKLLRPDRIMLKENKAKVIDFKTGEYKEQHKKQIHEYGNVLSRNGYEVEKILLYFTSEGVERREVS